MTTNSKPSTLTPSPVNQPDKIDEIRQKVAALREEAYLAGGGNTYADDSLSLYEGDVIRAVQSYIKEETNLARVSEPDKLDEIIQDCIDGQHRAEGSFYNTKQALTAYIKEETNLARIDELQLLKQESGPVYTLYELSERGSHETANSQEVGEGITADAVIEYVHNRIAELKPTIEKEIE